MGIAELLRDFAADPARHPNLPDVSFAGCGYGEDPFPEPKAVIDVRERGAIGDGEADDYPVFRAVCEEASRTGNRLIRIPAGTYRIDGCLRIGGSGVVLRGEGPERTVLSFPRSLEDHYGENPEWSYRGALVWFAPEDNEVPVGPPAFPSCVIQGPVDQGATEIRILGRPEQLQRWSAAVGATVLLRWHGDQRLAETIFGQPLGQTVDWPAWKPFQDETLRWEWPNQVVAVDGDRIRFRQPLRLPIHTGWIVSVGPLPWAHLVGVGVEDLCLRMPEHPPRPHLKDAGFNSVFFERVGHGRIRRLRLEQVDNGIVLERSWHNSVEDFAIVGGRNHHATSCRYGAHDNLFRRFRIESRIHHGINCQDLASGNVWSGGSMAHGVFDCHRGMAFDSVRTDISISPDGGPGGAGDGCPYAGRRMVHWYIRIVPPLRSKSLVWIASPDVFSFGALVGIQGVDPVRTERPWAMPPGDKGTLVLGTGVVPDPPDLYEWQRQRRLAAAGGP